MGTYTFWVWVRRIMCALRTPAFGQLNCFYYLKLLFSHDIGLITGTGGMNIIYIVCIDSSYLLIHINNSMQSLLSL